MQSLGKLENMVMLLPPNDICNDIQACLNHKVCAATCPTGLPKVVGLAGMRLSIVPPVVTKFI